jgi:hypothetical protein
MRRKDGRTIVQCERGKKGCERKEVERSLDIEGGRS